MCVLPLELQPHKGIPSSISKNKQLPHSEHLKHSCEGLRGSPYLRQHIHL